MTSVATYPIAETATLTPKLQRWQQLGILRPLDVVLVQMLQSKASELPVAVAAKAR